MIIPLLFALCIPSPFQPINKVQLEPTSGKFDFIVLGDNRPAGRGLPITDTFKEMLAEVAMIHPAFVLSSGDLVYGNEEPLETYRHEMDDMQSLLGKLGVPFYNAPGNHEIAQRPEFEKEYVSRFGALFGSFEYGGWRFIALSTDQGDAAANISPAEQSFLSEQFQKDMPTCVYMHRPIFARKAHAEEGATVKQAASLHELFKSHGVRAVFEGHDHVYNHQQHDGIDYIISGGAGAPLDALPQDGGFFHYIVAHVDGSTITFDVIPSRALNVIEDGKNWEIANYADVDLELRDLVLSSVDKPGAVKATVDKKGKAVDVPAAITSVKQAQSGWEVHVHTLAAKHRKTTISFMPG